MPARLPLRFLPLAFALAAAGCAAPAVVTAPAGPAAATAEVPPAPRLPETPVAPAVVAPATPAMVIGARPLPGPMPYPVEFRRAVQNGTRTLDGAPGARYWVNRASYDLTARIDPATKRIDGTARIRYTNNSPNALPQLVMELTQNVHAAGSVRLDAAEITGGTTLDALSVNGQALAEGTGYRVDGTVLTLRLPAALASGATAEISAAWHYTQAQEDASGRAGYSPAGDRFGTDPSLVYVGYWYPQMAVYDDVRGWNRDPFLGPAEFYMDAADYTYTVEVPAGWLVQGTGTLENAADVLAPETRARLARAAAADTPLRIADATDTPTRAATGPLRYRFTAPNVRDVAFSVTKGYVWDAGRANVGDRDGDGRDDYALSQALWRTRAPRWQHVARYNQISVASHSRVSGLPYPYPHMTAVEGEGIIGGGMEYPMMTLIGAYTNRTDADLFSVTAHEIAHMWNPMVVGNDERRYGWQDEGHTMYHENQAEKVFAPGDDPLDYDREDAPTYAAVARAGQEGEMMRRTEYQYPGPAATVASYDKPVSVLVALRELIGEEAFARGWQAYHRTWAYKHPTPYDFFHTMQTAAGRDLSWFWQAWYFTTWQLDQAVDGIDDAPGGGSLIRIRDAGQVPMPVWLTLTYADGRTERRDVPVETWLAGATTATVAVPGRVVKAEIDARRLAPDVDRTNNVWPR